MDSRLSIAGALPPARVSGALNFIVSIVDDPLLGGLGGPVQPRGCRANGPLSMDLLPSRTSIDSQPRSCGIACSARVQGLLPCGRAVLLAPRGWGLGFRAVGWCAQQGPRGSCRVAEPCCSPRARCTPKACSFACLAASAHQALPHWLYLLFSTALPKSQGPIRLDYSHHKPACSCPCAANPRHTQRGAALYTAWNCRN